MVLEWLFAVTMIVPPIPGVNPREVRQVAEYSEKTKETCEVKRLEAVKELNAANVSYTISDVCYPELNYTIDGEED